MKTWHLIILAIIALGNFDRPVYGDIVYSNLGEEPALFSQTNGWTIGYPFSSNECGQSMAYSFVSPGNFQLTSVKVAIKAASYGQPDFVAAIYRDTAGFPGQMISSMTGIAPVSSGPPTELTEISFLDEDVILLQGIQYWLGLHPAHSQGTDLGWYWNIQEDLLTSECWQSNFDKLLAESGWERYWDSSIEPAYQINGMPIPEPASLLLLGIGGLSIMRKRG